MLTTKLLSSKDFLLGAFYIAVGAIYGGYTLEDLPIGSALNMGPGYFPLVLSALLIIIGVIVALRTTVMLSDEAAFSNFPWRGFIMISLASIAFALLARGAGIILASIVTVMIASWASREATWKSSMVTSIILAAFCAAVFVYGMGLPLGMLGTWFG
ncbi:tripartite tricarboxylate transporter TctB family protein [Corticibacterium sp. UT-5YL-CI-8]|nr:tripartite tricarboxylate transporter TctB family protein [Tianweitania sp. UT-5YL-CI-8]